MIVGYVMVNMGSLFEYKIFFFFFNTRYFKLSGCYDCLVPGLRRASKGEAKGFWSNAVRFPLVA